MLRRERSEPRSSRVGLWPDLRLDSPCVWSGFDISSLPASPVSSSPRRRGSIVDTGEGRNVANASPVSSFPPKRESIVDTAKVGPRLRGDDEFRIGWRAIIVPDVTLGRSSL